MSEEENVENFNDFCDRDDVASKFILSLCWDSGILAASYYNLSSLEISIIHETIDLRPDHIQLRNLFRQIQPSFLVASASNQFLKDLIELLDLPENTDINKYKVSAYKSANANTFNISFFTYNRNNQHNVFRKRIYELDLPGLPAESSKSDRHVFIDSVFPMNQELVIICLGNLLKYLDENRLKWRHVFMSAERNPIITNVIVCNMKTQLLLDDTTFNSLNIFSNVHHPSSFKTQIRRDGLSLFNMLNQCCSSVGVQELRGILKQPTRDLSELNLRLSTIEWCLQPENHENVVKIRSYLHNILNISGIMSRIITNHGKTGDWRSLKKTIYFSFNICELCASFNQESIKETCLQDLANFTKDEYTIKSVLFVLEKILDLDMIDEKRRFTVKEGLDLVLDEKRESLEDMKINFMQMGLDKTLTTINNQTDAWNFVHFREMGFVIGTKLQIEDMNIEMMIQNKIELVLKTVGVTYFRSPNCKILNAEYEQKLTDIIDHEMRIFNRLITYINEHFAEIIDITKLCAKLDVLISFASVAATYKFTKPSFTTRKEITIVNGRHPLVQLLKEYVPSTTIVNENENNFVNIICAPNASGKSIYMKQIALICFMSHIGCYVPADECKVSILHSIFTRIYTPESVYQCSSAFMEDLQQMSKVIMNSTDRSLIIIDEFGKGTHYKDGIAFLVASIEHFADRGIATPITFVTTHYTQMFKMIKLKDVMSLKTIITRKNESGVFESLYKISDGLSNEQQFFTEFPESNKIMKNIFERKTDEDYETFTSSYNGAIKAFVLILVKMFMKKGLLLVFFIGVVLAATEKPISKRRKINRPTKAKVQIIIPPVDCGDLYEATSEIGDQGPLIRKVQHNMDCKKYFECVTNRWLVRDCPDGTTFNGQEKGCDSTKSCRPSRIEELYEDGVLELKKFMGYEENPEN
ncbi:CLUMA_CG015182, isoform A [Clunio marinus]|uniref:CLUMA_CG015182, isoform A n=1 Tax=Clunio marinus TaxID=568069 RepID=A0A1J1IQ93_9DIPT|nr:CLUMA_CG015182, isoform A [Clunio marinus]